MFNNCIYLYACLHTVYMMMLMSNDIFKLLLLRNNNNNNDNHCINFPYLHDTYQRGEVGYY